MTTSRTAPASATAAPATAASTSLRPLTGAERFRGLDATVVDFWRFAMSDLQVDAVRGSFAEFLVQQAVGVRGAREEWASHHVTAPDGTTIEVTTPTAQQPWDQVRPSSIVFSRLRSRAWAPDGWTATATFHADVYVFAVQAATDRAAYDPLNVRQWQFHVLPREDVEARGCDSLSLATVQHLAGLPLSFDELADAVRRAASQHAG